MMLPRVPNFEFIFLLPVNMLSTLSTRAKTTVRMDFDSLNIFLSGDAIAFRTLKIDSAAARTLSIRLLLVCRPSSVVSVSFRVSR